MHNSVLGSYPWGGGRIVAVSVIIALGVNTDGRRAVLGMEIGTSEAEAIWTELLRKLTGRGSRGGKYVGQIRWQGFGADIEKCA